jgi:hypothetical protein
VFPVVRYGALNYFMDGGTKEGFIDMIKDKSVYGFQRSDI